MAGVLSSRSAPYFYVPFVVMFVLVLYFEQGASWLEKCTTTKNTMSMGRITSSVTRECDMIERLQRYIVLPLFVGSMAGLIGLVTAAKVFGLIDLSNIISTAATGSKVI